MMGFNVGIDAGSTSVNAVVVDDNEKIIFSLPYKRHSGRIVKTVEEALSEIYRQFDIDEIESVTFTGMNSRSLANELDAPFQRDVLSQLEGAVRLNPDVKAIISFGGQDCGLLLVENKELLDFSSNDACAAGTGSFIEVQALRNLETEIKSKGFSDPSLELDYAIRKFIEIGMESDDPANVAAKCTVFAKTDMIHLGNNNVPQKDIFAGLVKGLVRTYMADVVENRTLHESDSIIIGGGALNELLVKYFRDYFPELRISEYPISVQAYGAALLSKRTNKVVLPSLNSLVIDTEISRAPKLEIEKSQIPDDKPYAFKFPDHPIDVYLGVDVGSTTTKCALVYFDDDNQPHVVHKEYIKTEGAPITAVKKLLTTIRDNYAGKSNIKRAASTGSGRRIAGEFLGVDEIVDEITAHALAAVTYDKTVDSVFELGGQDSKYISIENGYEMDFTMNKICAAGTGSFFEEMAEKFSIDIKKEFEQLALSADYPVALGERCTVFMESDATSALQKGATLEEVCAGLALAVGHNYISRVVEKRNIGKNIMFLGGPSQNKSIVAALEQITGSRIVVPENSEVFGAMGAAIHAKNNIGSEEELQSTFRGYGVIDEELVKNDKQCKKCANECTLHRYKIPIAGDPEKTRALIFGGVCGEYESGHPDNTKAKNYFTLRREEFERSIVTPKEHEKKVILPRHLFMHQLGVLWTHFFDAIDVQPVWDEETCKEMVEEGTKITPSTFCFSKAVSNGHIIESLKHLNKYDTYIFLPTMIDMKTPTKNESGQYCPWAAASFYTTQAIMPFNLDRILTPHVELKKEPSTTAYKIYQELGPKCGVDYDQVLFALEHGLHKQENFDSKLHFIWEHLIKREIGNNIAFVVAARPYLLFDNRLNLNIGSEIAKIGIPAVPMDFLPISDQDIRSYDNMYWGQGARMIRLTKYIKENPNLFMVYISNFNCGPDSFVLKYVDREINRDFVKPHLELELDAHSGRAGIITRIEAFKNVVQDYYNEIIAYHESSIRKSI